MNSRHKLYDYSIRPDGGGAPSKLLRLVGKNRRVLEIGCSAGSQTRVLSGELGCQVFALEIDPQAAELARPYCHHLVVGNIESIAVDELAAGRPYDVVLFADVLEHLFEPQVALEKVRPLIARDGYLLASIPNVTHSALVFEMMNGRFEYRDYGLLDFTHIRFFDRHGVLRLFDEAGYFVEDMDRVVIPADKTEFRVEAADGADRFVLDYMKRRNPESETFQFIVRAVPARSPDESKSALESAKRRLQEQERQITRLRETLARRDSEVAWLERRPWDRLTGFVRRTLRKR